MCKTLLFPFFSDDGYMLVVENLAKQGKQQRLAGWMMDEEHRNQRIFLAGREAERRNRRTVLAGREVEH